MKSIWSLGAALAIFLLLPGSAQLRAEGAPLKLVEAIEAQRRLIEHSPADPELHNDLGNLLFESGRIEAAQEAYETSLDLDPDLISARYNYALLLQQIDRPRRAEREYKRVTKAQPRNSWAHYQTGVLLAQRGKRAAAIQSYARSMRLNPRLTDPAFNPHILENALASSAVLWAYADLSSAALAPRIYENPGNVTDLLLAAQSGAPHPEKRLLRKQRRREKNAKSQ